MENETKICPHCGREILAIAKKCRYCKEWIETADVGPTDKDSKKDNDSDSATPSLPEGESSTSVENQHADSDNYQIKSESTGSVGPFIGLLILLAVLITLILAVSGSQSGSDSYSTGSSSSYETESDDYYDIYSCFVPAETTDSVEEIFCSGEDEPIESNNKSEEERVKELISGTYLAIKSGLGGYDNALPYGRYIVTPDNISFYSWDENRETWDLEYSSPYSVKYLSDNDYMTGFNLFFSTNYGRGQLCVGDTNNDDVLDLWCSDGLFHTKIANL